MILILIGLIVLMAVFEDSKKFRCDYTYYKDIGGWVKMHIIPETWREARLRCHLEGTNLVSSLNRFFVKIMTNIMMTQTDNFKRGIFTCIHSTFLKGDYHSIENIPLLKIPHRWAEREPDNMNNKETCIMTLPSGDIKPEQHIFPHHVLQLTL